MASIWRIQPGRLRRPDLNPQMRRDARAAIAQTAFFGVFSYPVFIKQVRQTLIQIYGLRIANILTQLYGNSPQLRGTLEQYYNDAAKLRRTLDMRWGDSPKYRAALDQLFNLQEGLRAALGQPYAIAEGSVRAVLDQIADLQDKDLMRVVLDMIYVLAAGESLVQSFDIAVVCDGVQHNSMSNINIEQDGGNYYMVGELQLHDVVEYLQYKKFESVVSITVNGWTVQLIAEVPRSSRQPGVSTYIVPLVSRTKLLDSPHSNLAAQELVGMASALVTTLAAGFTISWQLVDWFIPAGRLSVNDGDAAINIIRQIVEAVGGVVQTSPDGVLVCRPEYPISVDRWGVVVPDFSLTDQDDFFQIDYSPEDRLGYNVFNVSDSQLAADGITMEPTTIDNFTVEYRVWQIPWDALSKVNLLHSGDLARVSVVANGVVIETINDEMIEIVEGSGRTAKPVFDHTTYDYRETELGVVTISEDGTVTTTTAGNSLIYLDYRTRYWLFTVTDHTAEAVQFFPEEVAA